MRAPGTILGYMAFNTRDPVLRDVRVRQAIAYAIDRGPLLQYIWRGFAQPAQSVLLRKAGRTTGCCDLPSQSEKARQMLDAAGYPARDGIRFHIAMKTSTEESTRLLAAVLQQQLGDVGIVLDIRTFEFATFLCGCHPRRLPVLFPALDRRQSRSRYFRNVSLSPISAGRK